jgi:CDGSH-type Zn-finger protein
VFLPNVDGPWIKPDAAGPEAVMAVVEKCPSGALRYAPGAGAEAEQPPTVNTVRVWENGPLAFHGELDIKGDTSSFRATLCRCGLSKRKPFCDHSHAEGGFTATGEPATGETPALAVRNGPLKITPQPDGPLLVEGALEICAASGRTISRTTKTWLCRCGQSCNKPFCDSSHRRAGFKDSGNLPTD